ncbi:unnamed protein product, partial [marine sediment metagenome]
YPVFCFIIAMVFFFLAIKKLFNTKIALLSTAFLAVVPTFLYRTMAGFSDKEPLAMMLLFMTFYFFTLAWQSKKTKQNIIFGAIAGVTTAFTTMAWGGGIYIFLIIGMFAFLQIILNKFSKKDLYTYTSWMIILTIVLVMFSNGRFHLKDLIVSFSTGIVYMVFLIALINYLIFKKDILKIKNKINLPKGISSIILGLIFIIILASIFFGPSFITGQIKEITSTMIHP